MCIDHLDIGREGGLRFSSQLQAAVVSLFVCFSCGHIGLCSHVQCACHAVLTVFESTCAATVCTAVYVLNMFILMRVHVQFKCT